MKKKKISEFVAFEPVVRPAGKASGGGFRVQLDVPETEFEEIKDLNNPKLKNTNLRVKIYLED